MAGFEVFYQTIRADLTSKNDLLVGCVHFQCIQRGLVGVGVGEQFTETDESSAGSQLMTNGWNQSQDTYVLRYINAKTKQKLLIKCVKVSDILIVSALIVSADSNGSSVTLQTNDYIADDYKTFGNAFVSGSVDSIAKKLDEEVFDKLWPKPTTATDESSLREPSRQRHDPLREPMPAYGPNYGGGLGYDPMYGGAQWPPPYGGADLDPLGRAQGGMIMDPRAFPGPFGVGPRNPAPGLPRGAIPPGARFDPFGPLPGIGPIPNRNPRHSGPDPDHMPPPGYDDMFM